MIEMASKQLIPAEIKYAGMLSDAVNSMEAAGVKSNAARKILSEVTEGIDKMQDALTALKDELAKAQKISNHKDCAFAYRDHVKTAMDQLRKPADSLEVITDKEYWPIPTYGDLLFEV